MDESRSVHDALAALARRWRIVVPFALVTPLVVLVLTLAQPSTYESSAEVLLDRPGLLRAELRDPTFLYPAREIRTQAELARLPDIARRVVAAAGLQELGAFGFLAKSSVVADGATDLMSFHVRDNDPAQAARLATVYAEQYIAHRKALDTRSLRKAIAVVDEQIEQARAQSSSAAYADMVRNQQQLHTALASLESNATLVRPALEATRVAPRPLRAALLGLALGLAVGIGIAGLTSLLDARARTAEEISGQLGLPLLGRLPLERRTRRHPQPLVMLAQPDGPGAEAIRVLRANLELDPAAREHGVVMVTSSVAGEGKSTTVANLAVALAQAGRNVVLVDLDLLRPTISRLFGLPSSPGIADVVRGTVALDEAAHHVPLERPGAEPRSEAAEDSTRGSLRVVSSGGRLPADTTEFVAARALPAVLDSLRGEADLVLVDCPPLLQASDALTLGAYVDGLLFVARRRTYRPRYGNEITRLLALSPTTALGVVVVVEPQEVEPVGVRPHAERRLLDRGPEPLGGA